YFAHAYNYALRNPVVAGSVLRVEDYAFSSFQREFRESVPGIFKSIHTHPFSRLIPRGISERVQWLNTEYNGEQAELLKRAFTRTVLTFPTHRRHWPTVLSLQLENSQK